MASFTSSSRSTRLREQYPWTTPNSPLIVSAPMRLIAGPQLSAVVTKAGGLGFLASGTDTTTLPSQLEATAELLGIPPPPPSRVPSRPESRTGDILAIEKDKDREAPPPAPAFLTPNPTPAPPQQPFPIGIGFINWGADMCIAIEQIAKWRPAAVWFFAPAMLSDLVTWTRAVRDASQDQTRVWVQIGTVKAALDVAESCQPDVLVVQGSDAGGHGLKHSASLMTLLPECADALKDAGFGHVALVAAGGIVDSRGAAAALALGADGVCLGTRFLATPEAVISKGYRQAVLEATDGGVATVRSQVYDRLRGTTGWPDAYDARGVINASYRDHQNGMTEAENKHLYQEALKIGDSGWGAEQGRITTYAGTGVGLIKEIKPAAEVVKEIREGIKPLE